MSLVIILAATQGLLVGSGMCTQGCRTLSPTMMAVNPAIAVREAAKKAAQLNEQDAPAFSQSVPLEPATASSLADMHEPSARGREVSTTTTPNQNGPYGPLPAEG